MVALSLTVSLDPKRAMDLLDEYAEACAGLPWLVGGLGAQEFEDEISTRGGRLINGLDDLDGVMDALNDRG